MLLLALIAWALLRATRRLPISQFFTVSSVVIGVLAVVLVGKGVAALQEAGMVGLASIAGPRVTWLGVYPSLQTIVAQLLVAVLTIVGFVANYFGARGGQSAMVRHEESHSD
jgi:high-affinity iron transporter